MRWNPARELLAKVKYAVGCTSGFGDFTYRKPNRRQPQGGALLPAHVKPILVVTDGYTGWPPKPVGPRVVACLTQAGTADSVPKWIDAVVLNPTD